MKDLQTISSDELAGVNGGEVNWQSIGQSVLGGLFNSVTQGMQSGQGGQGGQGGQSGQGGQGGQAFDGILRSLFSGGLSAFTKGSTGPLNSGGQSQ